MLINRRSIISLLLAVPALMSLVAQNYGSTNSAYNYGEQALEYINSFEQEYPDSIFDINAEPQYESLLDSLLANVKDVKQVMSAAPLPRAFFLPIVFTNYALPSQPRDAFEPEYSGDPALVWIEDAQALERKMNAMRQYVFIHDPSIVRYNIRTLPNPPKEFSAVINPEEHTIEIIEKKPTGQNSFEVAPQTGLIHWLKEFNANLQFSQAYISPNWYQGGNNNLNMLSNIIYNVKLNQKLHPTLLFETTLQYKLGLNSAPDDSIRSYNISEDLLQITSTFGIKAIKKWYYTANLMFKTQLLNSYKKNTRDLRAAFLSPAELNFGLGMTYNTTNKKNTVKFDASISPLSYNLMVCTSDRINHGQFKIDPDKKTASKYGSSAELKLNWTICSNIKLLSRLFTFTDYDRFYTDFENTLSFEINKYLTTQIFGHLRYDTLTPKSDPDWHKLQVKEILSIGFSYKFTTI